MTTTESLYRTYYGSNLTRRQANDFYQTPAVATRALLDRVRLKGMIWEPACGRGAIVRVLQEYYPPGQVAYSDLVNYHLHGQGIQDFLETTIHVPNIITNAPYSQAGRFVDHAVECASRVVAMLFRLDFIQSKKRKELFERTRLTDLYVFSYRLKFVIRGKPRGMVPYGWFILSNRANRIGCI